VKLLLLSSRYRTEVCSTKPQKLHAEWSKLSITDCYSYGTPNKDFVECCTARPFYSRPIPIHQNVKLCSGIQPSDTSTIRSYESGTDDCCYRQVMEYNKYCVERKSSFDTCRMYQKRIAVRCTELF